MTPEEAKGRVLDYAYGEMSPDEAARFEALMASDPILRAEVEAVRGVREAASRLAAVPMPGDVRVRLLREAERYARKRAGRHPVFWSLLERFLLSPAFTGAMVVVVAVGIGVHLLLEMGTEDRLTRIERAERVALSEPDSREVPAAPGGDEGRAGMEAPVGGTGSHEANTRGRFVAESSPRGAKDEAKTTPAAKEPAKARKTAPLEKVALGPPPAPSQTVLDRDDKGFRAEQAVTGPPSAEAVGMAGSRRSGATHPAREETTRLPAARPHAAPTSPPASEAAPDTARTASVEEREPSLDDARADLARARHLKSRGALDAALAAYREALKAGTLTGSDLEDALAEAAEVAIALRRPDTARAYLDRLKTLPGGPARAAPLERHLDQTEPR